MCLGGFMVLNMLLGVICSVVSEANALEKERMLMQRVEEELSLAESSTSSTNIDPSAVEPFSPAEQKQGKRLTVVEKLSTIGFDDEHLLAICELYGKAFNDPNEWEDVDKRE